MGFLRFPPLRLFCVGLPTAARLILAAANVLLTSGFVLCVWSAWEAEESAVGGRYK
jgi:hypothetical protein